MANLRKTRTKLSSKWSSSRPRKLSKTSKRTTATPSFKIDSPKTVIFLGLQNSSNRSNLMSSYDKPFHKEPHGRGSRWIQRWQSQDRRHSWSIQIAGILEPRDLKFVFYWKIMFLEYLLLRRRVQASSRAQTLHTKWSQSWLHWKWYQKQRTLEWFRYSAENP